MAEVYPSHVDFVWFSVNTVTSDSALTSEPLPWRIDVFDTTDQRYAYFRLPKTESTDSFGGVHGLILPWWLVASVWLAVAIPSSLATRPSNKYARGFPASPHEHDPQPARELHN
jgi:hypothetical protein